MNGRRKMSLLQPTPGELYDRLCIVKLKLDFCKENNLNEIYNQFLGEQYELNAKVQGCNEDLRKLKAATDVLTPLRNDKLSVRCEQAVDAFVLSTLQEQAALS